MAGLVHEQLTVDDLFRAADLVAAVLDELDPETIKQLRGGEADPVEIGREFITIAIRVAPESGKRFLAGLMDKAPQEFGALPMDRTLDLVEELSQREDLVNFFKRARDLAGNIGIAGSTEKAESEGAAGPAK